MSNVFTWNESLRFPYQHKYDSRCSHESTSLALRSIYTRCSKLKNRKIFDILDSIALSATEPDIAARTLAQAADALAAFAGRGSGIRVAVHRAMSSGLVR